MERNESVRRKALTAHRRFRRFHGGLPSLSYAGLVSLQDVNPLLVDVRTDAERLVSIIPGAIPSRQVDKELLRMDAERPLVAVCTVGLRAGLWASNFAEKQECNRQIFVYEGILLHALDGGEVVKQTIRADGQTINTPVEAVHCFARSFEFAPDGWETAVFPPSIALFESLKLLPRMLKALLRSLLLSRASTGS